MGWTATAACTATAFLFCGATVCAGTAAADPAYVNASAQSVVDQLEAEGYNVVINWLTGFDTKPLSVCWVTHINNPDWADPAPGVFSTVYVDVACPNDEYP